MLLGIDPVLTGQLLAALDAMGHTDSVVVADAHFPAARLANGRQIDLPELSTPRVLKAICSVLPLDDAPGLDLMDSTEPDLLPVQRELVEAAGLEPAHPGAVRPDAVLEPTRSGDGYRLVERYAFYDLAAQAQLIIRTGETRIYGNALVRKGVVPTTKEWA